MIAKVECVEVIARQMKKGIADSYPIQLAAILDRFRFRIQILERVPQPTNQYCR